MIWNGNSTMDGGMMWGMGLLSLLIIVLVVLGIVALAKYVFGGRG